MTTKILKAYNIPPSIVRTISKLYGNTRVKVIIPGGETEHFEVKAGILQGDMLAPYLSAIILDYVMHRTYGGKEEKLGFKLPKQRSRQHQAVIVTDLDYADDLLLLTEKADQAQEMLNRLGQESEKVELYCNAKKMELLIFNHEMCQ